MAAKAIRSRSEGHGVKDKLTHVLIINKYVASYALCVYNITKAHRR